LTALAEKYNLSQNLGGGGYMKGYVRYHAPANRHYVGLYWHGKEERFWRYQGEPLFDKRTGIKLLSKIQADIDNGTFDPRTYRPDSPLSLKEYSTIWLETSTACKNTKKGYRNAMNKAIDYFGADHDIRHFTYSKLLKFKSSLNLSNDAEYNIMGALKTMLNFYRRDLPSFILPVFPSMSKTQREDQKYLTFEDQQSVLQAIPERNRPIFIVMMEYGIRPQEATALKWDCVDFDKNEITFKRSHSEYELRETTKTGSKGIRTEQITQRAKESLRMAKITPSFKGFVFCHNKQGSHYDNKLLNRLWRSACQETNINIGLYEGVRHSWGCQLMDMPGVTIDMVQDGYRHTSSKTTRRYAHRKRSVIADLIENRGKVINLDSAQIAKKK